MLITSNILSAYEKIIRDFPNYESLKFALSFIPNMNQYEPNSVCYGYLHGWPGCLSIPVVTVFHLVTALAPRAAFSGVRVCHVVQMAKI